MKDLQTKAKSHTNFRVKKNDKISNESRKNIISAKKKGISLI